MNIAWLYHEKGLHNYFIPRHRKYSDKMGRLGVIRSTCSWITLIDGKIWWTADQYSTAFRHCDWLYFLWHGIKYLSRYWTEKKSDRRWFVLELVPLRGEKNLSSHAHKTNPGTKWDQSPRRWVSPTFPYGSSPWKFASVAKPIIFFFALVRLVFRNVITCYHVKFTPKS